MKSLFSKSFRRSVCVSGMLLFLAMFFVSTALADQVKVLDNEGHTQSMLNVTEGMSAEVKVQLKAEDAAAVSGVSVALVDVSSKQEKQSAVSDSAGVVLFNSVTGGTYLVRVKSAAARVETVDIVKSEAAGADKRSVSDAEARKMSRAMYVGGASAVVGALGVTAATANSGSGSGSGSDSLGFMDTDTGVVKPMQAAPQAAPAGLNSAVNNGVQPLNTSVNSIEDPNRPDPNGIGGAPNPGGSGQAPPTGNPQNPIGNDPDPENPDEPGDDDIAPAPDIIDPMTPS